MFSTNDAESSSAAQHYDPDDDLLAAPTASGGLVHIHSKSNRPSGNKARNKEADEADDDDVYVSHFGLDDVVSFILNGSGSSDNTPNDANASKSTFFTNVALQFPDSMLPASVRIVAAVKRRITMDLTKKGKEGREAAATGTSERPPSECPVSVYVVADNTFGACCPDETTALHNGAQCIVHFGPACYSRSTRLPVFYVPSPESVQLNRALLQLHQSSASSEQDDQGNSAAGNLLQRVAQELVAASISAASKIHAAMTEWHEKSKQRSSDCRADVIRMYAELVVLDGVDCTLTATEAPGHHNLASRMKGLFARLVPQSVQHKTCKFELLLPTGATRSGEADKASAPSRKFMAEEEGALCVVQCSSEEEGKRQHVFVHIRRAVSVVTRGLPRQASSKKNQSEDEEEQHHETAEFSTVDAEQERCCWSVNGVQFPRVFSELPHEKINTDDAAHQKQHLNVCRQSGVSPHFQLFYVSPAAGPANTSMLSQLLAIGQHSGALRYSILKLIQSDDGEDDEDQDECDDDDSADAAAAERLKAARKKRRKAWSQHMLRQWNLSKSGDGKDGESTRTMALLQHVLSAVDFSATEGGLLVSGTTLSQFLGDHDTTKKEEKEKEDSHHEAQLQRLLRNTSKLVLGRQRQRMYNIEAVKKAQSIGIVVLSLAIHGYRETAESLRRLIIRSNRRAYILYIGHLNHCKLGNFVDSIDCFAVIACPSSRMAHYSQKKDGMLKPVVSPMEVVVALGLAEHDCGLGYSTRFQSMCGLEIGDDSHNTAATTQQEQTAPAATTASKEEVTDRHDDEQQDKSKYQVSTRCLNNAVIGVPTALQRLQERSWMGLEVRAGETEVQTEIVMGKRGIARGYSTVTQEDEKEREEKP